MRIARLRGQKFKAKNSGWHALLFPIDKGRILILVTIGHPACPGRNSTHHPGPIPKSLNASAYIYIYVYMYVCVEVNSKRDYNNLSTNKQKAKSDLLRI